MRVREALGTGVLVLQTADPARPLDLYFEEEGERDLISLRSGLTVTATCGAAIEMAGVIALSNCTAASLS